MSSITSEMKREFKKILLLKGLEPISEYHFSMVKSLFANDLKLTEKAQNEYNRIQIADLMEEIFPEGACVDALIDLYKDIEELKDYAKTLKHEKLKVMRRWKAKGTKPVEQRNQDKHSTEESTSTMNKPETIKTPVLKENKTTKTEESKMQLTQEQSQLPETSVTSTLSTESLPQTPQMPPPTPPSICSTKKMNNLTTKTNNSKKKMLFPEQSQLPDTSATISCSSESGPQTPQMPPPAPSISSSTKKRKDTTTKTDDSKRMKLFQEQSHLPEPSTTNTCPTEGCVQIPQVPPPTPSSSSLIKKKPRLKAVPKEASREEGFQRGPKEVMVLKATEPFAYAFLEGEKKMFHATVATESQFFQMKVFDVSLKEKFIPKKVIAISDYIGRNGFLEVYNASSVSDVNADRKMEVSKRLIANANATPKINHLCSQVAPGTFVNGVYEVHKKIVWNDFIYYEIQDDTGKMEVMVYGRLTKINCEERDKLQLICFELASGQTRSQLRSVIHSFIKVIKARLSITSEMESEYKRIVLLKGLEPISEYHFSMVKSLLARDLKLSRKAQNEYNRIQIADLMEVKFRGAACVDALIKLYKDIAELKELAKTLKNEKLKVAKGCKTKGITIVKKIKQDKSSTEKSTSTPNKTLEPESINDTPVLKKKKNKSIKTEESKMQLTQEQSQLPEPSRTSTLSTESHPQTSQMPPPTPPSISSTKKRNAVTTKTTNLKKEMLYPEQTQLLETSATSSCPTDSCPRSPQMPPPAPSISSKTKLGIICPGSPLLQVSSICSCKPESFPQKRKDIAIKTEESKRMKLFQQLSHLPEPSTTSTCPTEGCPQVPQMPPPTPSSSSLTKKPRLKSVPKEASKEEGLQTGPKEVMVLKATEPFAYAFSEGEKKMFHATVATESQFFQVKVFDVSLKQKFIPKKVIAISDYVGRNGFLEVYNASSVSDVNADRKMEVSKSLIANANATPKISHLCSQVAPGTFVNGVYQVHKKEVRNEVISYGIQDSTGQMEVIVYGRLTKINCEEGDKLQLICFELALGQEKQLRSVIHSFIKVIKARKSRKQPLNPDSSMQTSLEFS
ncbi:gamma-interferon-inducible protein 16-like [Equus asinus]|uniref:gamma-interferon-inducible protein 16-like n=1 Tax=Equus asinus TaxID=9793 RepID=UPI0038F79A33